MSRDIKVTIKLHDELSKSLRRVVKEATQEFNNLQKLFNSVKTSSKTSSNLGAIVGGNLISSAVGNLASSIVEAGQSLVGFVSTQFQSAANTERSSIGSIGSISGMLGVSLQTAESLQKIITKDLAQSAQTLPGLTADYSNFFFGFSDSLSEAKQLTTKGLSTVGKNLVELGVILANNSKKSIGYGATKLGQLVNDGTKKLWENDYFETNPQFKSALERILKSTGDDLKSFESMTAEQRAELLSKAYKLAYPQEILQRMSKTAAGQWEVITSKLTDDYIGLFGFLREIDYLGKKETVMGSVSKGLSAFLSGLESTGKLLTELGVKFVDPLLPIVHGFESFSKLLSRITGIIDATRIESEINKLDFSTGMGRLFSKLDIGGFLSNQVQNIVNTFKNIDMGEVGFTAMQTLIRGLTGFYNVATSWLLSNAPMIISVVGQAAYGLGDLITGMFGAIGVEILPLLGSALKFGLTGLAISTSALFGSVTALLSGMGEVIKNGIQSMVNGAVSAMGNAISAAIENITGSIQSTINSIRIPFISSGSNQKVGNAASGNLLSALNQERKMMPSGSYPIIANSSEIIIPQNKHHLLSQPIQMVNTFNVKTEQVAKIIEQQLTSIRNEPLSMTV